MNYNGLKEAGNVNSHAQEKLTKDQKVDSLFTQNIKSEHAETRESNIQTYQQKQKTAYKLGMQRRIQNNAATI